MSALSSLPRSSSLEAFLEVAPDAIVVADARGEIVAVNRLTEQMFGYARDELLGKPLETLVPERYRGGHARHREGYFADPRTRPMGADLSLSGRKKDGSEFSVEISLSPLWSESGPLAISIIRDITERRRAEEQIRASLREKEVLLREIHHRVKNNLQITSSLLRLQSASIQDARARELFAESQNRIRSMALVHEKLYGSSDLSRIDFSEYVATLAALLFRSFAVSPSRIVFRVEGERVFLSVDAAVPCGLIVNELISNAIKHAFPDGRTGEVMVRIAAEDGAVSISVRDDGIGLPPGFDIDRSDTLGLQLVRTLSDQLRAQLEVDRGPGAEFRVRFGDQKP